MKSLLITFCLLASFANAQVPDVNDPVKHPNLVNKTGVKELAGKPIEYYLLHKKINPDAKLFYEGRFAVSDDDRTFALVKEVFTDNNELRPFYFFLFNMVLNLSDGGLAEGLSTYCKEFIEKSPCEFIRLSNDKVYQVNRDRWAEFAAMAYNDAEDIKSGMNKITNVVDQQCKGYAPQWATMSEIYKQVAATN